MRTDRPPRTLAGVEDRAVQEARRLGKFWTLAGQVLERSLDDGFEPDGPIASHVPELVEEDRAFLSTFERLRSEVRRRYDAGDLAGAQGLLARFAEVDLREGYFPVVAGRLAVGGLPPPKVAALRVLHHVLTRWVELYAPIAPFAMEAIHRAFQPDGASVFDGTLAPALDAVVTAEAEGDYERWLSFGAALRVGRRRFGIPPTAELPRAVLLVNDEAVATRLRVTAPILSRLAHVAEILVGSPAQPWEGRRVEVRPILPAIQKTYGAQSARVVRILEQIPSRRVQDGVRAGTLSIALDGRQMPILAGMVEFAESLPDDVVPVAWGLGEVLISLPPDSERHRRRAPALSLDGYQIVRHLERRLQRAGGVAPELVVVSANGVLGEEMAKHALAVAQYAGVGQIAVNDGTITLPPAETSSGRTRRGERWRVYVPGLPIPPSIRKAQRSSAGRRRIPEFVEPRPEPEEFEVLEQSLREREESIRAIVEQIDHVVGRPVVGPAKVRLAVEAGLGTFEAIAHAPYDQLSAIPGFGPFVAGVLVESFGGALPSPTPRHRPRLVRPGNGETDRPTSPAAVVKPTYFPEVLVDPPPASTPPPLAPLSAPTPASLPVPLAAVPPPQALVMEPPVSAPAVAPVIVPAPVSAPVSEPASPPIPVPELVPIAPMVAILATPEPTALPPGIPGPSIPAAIPLEPPVPEGPPPPTSGVRLTLGDREDPAWRGFLDATSAGHRGLCLSREFPERRRALLGPRDVEVVWLSNVGKGSAVRPGDLPALTALLTLALTDRGVTAVFVEGGEYLVRIHGVGPVATLLRQLDALAVERSARIWWPINPALMPGADVEVLRGAVTVEVPEPAS
ncbi:MAG: DUF835 domain-containing protein [Thermoplasmata archaeon]|nr:DUF835 domain-containing protein [Thermoplasmata archaeon]